MIKKVIFVLLIACLCFASVLTVADNSQDISKRLLSNHKLTTGGALSTKDAEAIVHSKPCPLLSKKSFIIANPTEEGLKLLEDLLAYLNAFDNVSYGLIGDVETASELGYTQDETKKFCMKGHSGYCFRKADIQDLFNCPGTENIADNAFLILGFVEELAELLQ
jgi:hypothetical protein